MEIGLHSASVWKTLIAELGLQQVLQEGDEVA